MSHKRKVKLTDEDRAVLKYLIREDMARRDKPQWMLRLRLGRFMRMCDTRQDLDRLLYKLRDKERLGGGLQ